jgi:hypothetical protein
MGTWLPTSVQFRSVDHLMATLDRMAAHADPVGGVTTSVNLFDLKLPNGFRAVAVIPPSALGQPATVAFIRTESAPEPALPASSGRHPAIPPHVPATAPGTSPLESSTPGDRDPLTRYRSRIIERLISKLASLGVYDIHRVEVSELRKVVAAYISEYCDGENIYLSDEDRGRLLLEIMSAMGR